MCSFLAVCFDLVYVSDAHALTRISFLASSSPLRCACQYQCILSLYPYSPSWYQSSFTMFSTPIFSVPYSVQVVPLEFDSDTQNYSPYISQLLHSHGPIHSPSDNLFCLAKNSDTARPLIPEEFNCWEYGSFDLERPHPYRGTRVRIICKKHLFYSTSIL